MRVAPEIQSRSLPPSPVTSSPDTSRNIIRKFCWEEPLEVKLGSSAGNAKITPFVKWVYNQGGLGLEAMIGSDTRPATNR